MLKSRFVKVAVFLLCLAPILWLGWIPLSNVWRGERWYEGLTANPLEYITRYTGDWTLRMIVITLAISPLRKLLRQPDLIRFRRMIGLFAFFYGCLHFTTYLWLDRYYEWILGTEAYLSLVFKDIAKRPFITAGFVSFILMLPLAITSTKGWVRRMGGKRWQLLHRAVYFSAIAGVMHYFWLVKSDKRDPALYGYLIAILLLWRIVAWWMKRFAKPALVGRPVQQAKP
jgi:methionine sulfoxide reductase heme-binding subunit